MDNIPLLATHLVYPAGTRILEVKPYRPGYLDYPAHITVETPTGVIAHFVIKTGKSYEDLIHEAQVLKALNELGLPVPTVITEPVSLGKEGHILLLSECSGRPLPWLGVTKLNEAYLTYQLLQEGVCTLHELTTSIKTHPINNRLPHNTLVDELNMIIEQGGAWFNNDCFIEGLDLIQKILPTITTPLVFSNGDYNPLNFLYNGQNLTGWLDFTHACFEDPYIGWAKFQLWGYDEYGWGMSKKIGLVERILYNQNIQQKQFAPRLILRCLCHLQEGVGIKNPQDERPRQYLLNMLVSTIEILKHP